MINYTCDCCKRTLSDSEAFWAGHLSVVENNYQDRAAYIFHFCGKCGQNFIEQFNLKPLKYGDNQEEGE